MKTLRDLVEAVRALSAEICEHSQKIEALMGEHNRRLELMGLRLDRLDGRFDRAELYLHEVTDGRYPLSQSEVPDLARKRGHIPE